MAEEMVRRMGGKGKLLVLEGMPGQQTAADRLKGVKEVLAKSPGIAVISQTGKWTLDEGRNVTKNTLQRWPGLNAILGINGEMALGAVAAVKAAGKEGKITISSMDVYPTQVAAVKAGKIHYTISQVGVDQVNWSVVAAIRALNGEKRPKEIRTPVVGVTKENVDKYAEK
jgi:ribose transport system substrate-binding protein